MQRTFYPAAGEPAGVFDVPEEDPQAAASDQHQSGNGEDFGAWNRSYGWWSRRASDDSTWGRTWSSWHSSTWSESDEEGKWWHTPKGWVWGKSLSEGINYAVKKDWFALDSAFCAWWQEQKEDGVDRESCRGRDSVSRESDGSAHEKEGRNERSEHGESEETEGKKYEARKFSGKEKVPEHDGTTSMREYQRRVRIWQATSTISPEFQAGRLLERLSGDAWKAAETLEVNQLKSVNGVDALLRHLWDEMEPLEYLRVFQTLSFFYDQFCRGRGQEMTQYDTAFRTQCQRLAEAQSPLEGRAKAYWFLKKAGLSEDLRRQVVSSAGGIYDYGRLRAALVAIVPQVRRHDLEDNTKKDHHAQVRGRSPGGRSHKVHAVLDEGEDEDDHGDGGGSDLEDHEGCPAEELEMEAEVLLTAAARKRAQFTKGRGFEKARSESPQSRQKRIDDMKKRMPCAACKAAGRLVYGHWHSDPECPEFKKKAEDKSNAKPVFVVSQPSEQSEESDDDEAFIIHVILMATAEKLRIESACLALTDTACARSVAGQAWADAALNFMVEQGISFYVVDDRQPFRFGDGPRTQARYALVVPVAMSAGSKPVPFRISVVKEDVPLLLSAKALKAIGTVLDMANDLYVFKKLAASKPMIYTSTGHIGFELFTHLPMANDLLEIDWEGFLDSNEEVRFVERARGKEDCGVMLNPTDNPGPSKHVSGKKVRFHDDPEIKWFGSEDNDDDVTGSTKCEQTQQFVDPSPAVFAVASDHACDNNSKEEGRLCDVVGREDQPTCRGSSRDDGREIESDLPGLEGQEEDQPASSELAAIQQGLVARAVRGASGTMVQDRHQEGERVSVLASGSNDRGVGELCIRTQREPGGDAIASEPGGGSSTHVSEVHDQDAGSSQQSYWRSVLRMCKFPSVQGVHVTDLWRSPSWGDPKAAATGQGCEEPKGLCGFQSSGGGQQRGDGWNRSPSSSEGHGTFGNKLGCIEQCIRDAKPNGSCAVSGGLVGGREATGERTAEGREGSEGERDTVSLDWKAQPMPEDAVRVKIREGQRRRKYAKLGTCRRLMGNCKILASFLCMMTVGTLGAVGSTVGKLHQSWYGSDRPDVVEIFGGSAEVSLQFAHRGWSVMQPTDLIYGVDLKIPENRKRLVDRINEERPRLAIVSYPCRLWSKLADTNYRSSQERRRLAKLRKEEEPFLELCEEIFESQLARGDDALAENPLCSKAWSVPAMKRILGHPEVYAGVGHGCRFNVRSSSSGMLLKKPTLWVSTSPEICDALSLRCQNTSGHVHHEHGECQGGDVSRRAGQYTVEIAKAIHKGFVKTLKRKAPQRLLGLVKALKRRLGKEGENDKLLRWTRDSILKVHHDNFVHAVGQDGVDGAEEPAEDQSLDIGYEPGGIPEDGVSFVVPKGKKLDKVSRGLLRRIHCNLGHPSVKDLQRFMQMAGARQDLIEAASWLRCSSCAQSQRPRLHRSTRLPPHDLQFNDQVMVDCFHLKDSRGEGYWFISMLDRATMFHQVSWIGGHSPDVFVRALVEGWIKWAGTPGEISVDMERGFGAPEFVQEMGRVGSVVVAIAGQAHWQHGKIERHGQTVKDMMKRIVQQSNIKGPLEMSWAAIEACGAKNSLVREHGFSPNQLLFGKEPRCYGEIEENGEPCAFHFDVGDGASQVAKRMKYRHQARQAYIESQASQMLNRTARNKTRPWLEPQIGDKCFFFREVIRKDQKGKKPCWLGPGLVVGIQGQSNYWVVFGGRCYLVAQEHLREAVGEETLFSRPEVQEALSIFQQNKKGDTGVPYVDLTDQSKMSDEHLDAPVVGEEDVNDMEDEELIPDEPSGPIPDEPSRPVQNRFEEPPKELRDVVFQQGWHEDVLGNPFLVSHRAYSFRTPMPKYDGETHPIRCTWGMFQGKWKMLQDDVNWTRLEDSHEVFVGGHATVLVSLFKPKTRKQVCEESVPESIMKRRRRNPDDDMWEVFVASQSRRKAQKALDKEIPFKKIPPKDRDLFEKAEAKEWQSWLDYDAVEILDDEKSSRISSEKPQRILKSRFVYRDKHAGLVDESGNKLAVKAKARLCVQGQHCPDCSSGEVRVDAPTVQHGTLMLYLHLTVSFGWLKHWRNGDISSAFLQGAESKGEPLYMRAPEKGLPGIGSNQLLRLKRPVYGRPDAPRAWYEQLSGFIMREMGFERSVIDPAFFIHRDKQGEPDGLLVLHVDDLMVSTNGGPDVENKVSLLCERFPFGEWETVRDKPGGTTYCGKEIVVEQENGEEVIKLRQRGFVDGRLDLIPLDKNRKSQPESKATPEEVSDFRSVLGALQWLATQSRPDVAFPVNQLQKRVNCLEVKDLEVANQIVRIVKKNEVSLTFKNLGKDVAVVSYHDAGLYNSLGVEISEDDGDMLQSFRDKKLLYSQKGSLVGLVKREDLERSSAVPLNVLSWRSKSNKRIIESSFAAETHAALMGYGNGHFMRVLLLEVYKGSFAVSQAEGTDWFSQMPLVMATDCKSVYDCIKRDAQSVGDKSNAINVAILRQLCSGENHPVGERARLLWLPTRHQLADGLTKHEKASELQQALKAGSAVFHGLSAKSLRLMKESSVSVKSSCHLNSSSEVTEKQ